MLTPDIPIVQVNIDPGRIEAAVAQSSLIVRPESVTLFAWTEFRFQLVHKLNECGYLPDDKAALRPHGPFSVA